MRRKILVAFLALFAGVASAQTSITPGASSITSGGTSTSGCVAGGVLRSISNMVDCGAGLTYASGALTVGGTGAAATVVPLTLNSSRANYASNQYIAKFVGYADSSPTTYNHRFWSEFDATSTTGISMGSDTNTSAFHVFGKGSYGMMAVNRGPGVAATVSGSQINLQTGTIDLQISNGTTLFTGLSMANTGAVTIGSSSLGSTTVPITARLGTGSTANVLELQNSAGTNLAYFTAGGTLRAKEGDSGSPTSITGTTSTGAGFSFWSDLVSIFSVGGAVKMAFGNDITFYDNAAPNLDASYTFGLTTNRWASMHARDLYGSSAVEAVTTTKTPSEGEANETYTNTGDADGSAITLTNNPTVGTTFHFAVTVAQTVTITASAGETLMNGTSTCGTSLTSNAIGSTTTIKAVTGGSGAVWMTTGTEGTWTCTP